MISLYLTNLGNIFFYTDGPKIKNTQNTVNGFYQFTSHKSVIQAFSINNKNNLYRKPKGNHIAYVKCANTL